MSRHHHPEAVLAAIRDRSKKRADRGMPASWHWPYGWLIRLWAPDGSVHKRVLPPSATYADAAEVRDEEMANGGYEKAWLIRLEASPE